MSLVSDLLKQSRFGGRLLFWGAPTNSAARLDGVTQYWELTSPITVPESSDFEITMVLSGTRNSYAGLLEDSIGDSFWLRLMPDAQANNLQGYVPSAYISGVKHEDINLRDGKHRVIGVGRTSGRFYLKYDDTIVTTSAVLDIPVTVDRIGRFSGVEFRGIIYDFKVTVDGELVNHIPLKNKIHGADQQAKVGSVGATMANYSDAVWEDLQPEEVTYVPKLDGATQHWELSETLQLYKNDKISFDVLVGNDYPPNIAMILTYPGRYRTLLRVDNGGFTGGLGWVTENGEPVDNIARDGEVHRYTFELSTESRTLSVLGAQYTGEDYIRHFKAAIFNLRIERDGKVINEIPMVNPTQGETQLASVGTVNAKMINYTDSVWEKLQKPATYIAHLDGVTQAWSLTEDFQGAVGDIVKFKYIGPRDTSGDYALLGRGRNYAGISIYRSRDGGVVESNGGSLSVDGIAHVAPSLYPKNGNEVHNVEFELTSNISISTLLAVHANRDLGTKTWRFPGGMFDLEIIRGGSTILKIPMTNRAQGGTQLASVGGINAVMDNYSEAVWEKYPEAPEQVVRLDGASQYWELSQPLTIPAGEDFKLTMHTKMAPGSSGGKFILSSKDSEGSYGLNLYSTGDFSAGEGVISIFPLSLSVHGLTSNTPLDIELSRVKGKTTLTVNGVSNTTQDLLPNAFATATATNIGAGIPSGFYLTGIVKDVRLFDAEGKVVNHLELTNKEDGPVQTPNIGDATATLVNYTSSVWEESI